MNSNVPFGKRFKRRGASIVLGLFFGLLFAIVISPLFAAGLPQLEELRVDSLSGDTDCANLLPTVRLSMQRNGKKAALFGVWFEKTGVCKVYDFASLSTPTDAGGRSTPYEEFKYYLDARRFKYRFIDKTVVRISR